MIYRSQYRTLQESFIKDTYLNFFSSLGTLNEFQNLHDLFKDQFINVETLEFSRLDLSLVSEEDFDIFSSLGFLWGEEKIFSFKHKLATSQRCIFIFLHPKSRVNSFRFWSIWGRVFDFVENGESPFKAFFIKQCSTTNAN